MFFLDPAALTDKGRRFIEIVATSNSDLHDYLLRLEGVLRSHHLDALAVAVASASRQASGLNTEFLGESRIVLRRVLVQGENALSRRDRSELRSLLDQLDAALDHR